MISLHIHPPADGDLFSSKTGAIFGINEVRLNRFEIFSGDKKARFEANLVEWLTALTSLLKEARDSGLADANYTLPFSGERFRGNVVYKKEGELILFDYCSRLDVHFDVTWTELVKMHGKAYSYIEMIVSSYGISLRGLGEVDSLRFDL